MTSSDAMTGYWLVAAGLENSRLNNDRCVDDVEVDDDVAGLVATTALPITEGLLGRTTKPAVERNKAAPTVVDSMIEVVAAVEILIFFKVLFFAGFLLVSGVGESVCIMEDDGERESATTVTLYAVVGSSLRDDGIARCFCWEIRESRVSQFSWFQSRTNNLQLQLIDNDYDREFCEENTDCEIQTTARSF